jgi:membrane protease YdiL (CAAX protease family)
MASPSARTRYLLRTAAARPGAVSAQRGPVLIYGALSAVAIGAAIARGRSPVTLPTAEAWLPLGGVGGALTGHVLSLALGVALAFVTVKATRQFVQRWGWARALHANLRPAIRNAGEGTIVVLGLASAIGEELFFRGLLTATFGVVASSVAFGLLHQVRGRARWGWAGWAAVMGLLFGSLFLATGSLLGPIVAHAAINVVNLRFLRDTDFEPPKPRRLGGLLGRA